MAEEPAKGGLLMGAAAYGIASMTAAVSGTWNALMKDGALPAAARQGADEIGAALKAFPDTIQMSEPGTILNPTQGEIASARKPMQVFQGASGRSPSQVAHSLGGQGKDVAASQEQAQAAKTPSEVARDTSPAPTPGQERANVYGQGRE